MNKETVLLRKFLKVINEIPSKHMIGGVDFKKGSLLRVRSKYMNEDTWIGKERDKFRNMELPRPKSYTHPSSIRIRLKKDVRTQNYLETENFTEKPKRKKRGLDLCSLKRFESSWVYRHERSKVIKMYVWSIKKILGLREKILWNFIVSFSVVCDDKTVKHL